MPGSWGALPDSPRLGRAGDRQPGSSLALGGRKLEDRTLSSPSQGSILRPPVAPRACTGQEQSLWLPLGLKTGPIH